MQNLDHNALYRYYILLIVYSYILPRSIISQSSLSTEKGSRAAMAEPLHSIWRKGCVILSDVMLSISRRHSSSIIVIQFKKAAPKFARGIEGYLVYMVGDET
jgi:hypothetical protein